MEALYKNQGALLAGAIVVFVIGTVATTIAPLWFDELNTPIENVKPYTELEQKGRDLYISEGCVSCHTQQVRPLKSEVERYGHYSEAGEYVYDQPHQLGTRRIGPDLAREGGKRPDGWHRLHFKEPRKLVPGSVMPIYNWWSEDQTKAMIAYLQKLGTGIDWRLKVKIDVKENPFKNDAHAVHEGQELFSKNCEECHGENGMGEEDVAPNLTDPKWIYKHSEAELFRRVSIGTKKGMPSFRNDLSENERWKVVNYLLSIEYHGKDSDNDKEHEEHEQHEEHDE